MRGLRKLRKHIDAWSVGCVLPERPVLEEAGRHHARLRIDGIPELRLPGVYRGSDRLLKHAHGSLAGQLRSRLLEIACTWQERLESEPGTVPFRVFVWLKEIHALESQVVCEAGSSVGYYDRTWERRMFGRLPAFQIRGTTRMQPLSGPQAAGADFFSITGSSPGRVLAWECWEEREYFYEKLDELDSDAVGKLLRRGAVRAEVQVQGLKDISWSLFRDRVWVVRLLP